MRCVSKWEKSGLASIMIHRLSVGQFERESRSAELYIERRGLFFMTDPRITLALK